MASIVFLSENQTIISALTSGLSVHGIDLISLADTEQFTQKVLDSRPLMVVIDTAVSGGKGLASLEALRASSDVIASTPVVLADATGDLLIISKALQFHIADYFLTSRFDVAQALAKIIRKLPESAGVVVPVEMQKQSSPDTVLLIEDDRFLRDLAVQKFSQEKTLSVLVAVDGEQGVALAEKHIPDVILLDILLPGIDGFEVLRRIREKQQFNRTIICMLSNFGQREDVDKAMSLGANQFFVKANYTLDEIVAEVKGLLAKRKR